MSENKDKPVCAPLCGASKAYGRFDKPWHHEKECPVRQAWERERAEQNQDRASEPYFTDRPVSEERGHNPEDYA